MKGWVAGLPVEARAVAFGGVAVLVCVLIFAYASISWTGVKAVGNIARTKPTVGRLLGYEATAPEFQAAIEQLQAEMTELAYIDGQTSTRAGAALQQTLRTFAEESGAVVTGSQLSVRELVPVAEQVDDEDMALRFEVLVVDLSLEAPPIAIDALLKEIAEHQPRLATQSLEIQQVRQSRRSTDQPVNGALNVRLSVAALKATDL